MAKNTKVTRGDGFLEKFLAKKRAQMANRLISSKLREGRILDIGCGSYPYFLINTNFRRKFGIDKNVSLVNNIENLKLIKNSLEDNKLPFKSNFFHIVTALAFFEHVDYNKTINLLKEMRRVLRPNGLLILTMPASKLDKILNILSIFNLVSKEEIGEHKQIYNKSILFKQLMLAGFESDKTKIGSFEFGFNLYALIKK